MSSTPFQYLWFAAEWDHAAGATFVAWTRPLPKVAGALLADARRALSMNFGVRVSLRFSMW